MVFWCGFVLTRFRNGPPPISARGCIRGVAVVLGEVSRGSVDKRVANKSWEACFDTVF